MAKGSKVRLNLGKKAVEIHRVAHYAFFIGLLVAILSGGWFSLILNGSCSASRIVSPAALVTTLVVLGLLVGLVNLTTKETLPFLVAAIALMLAGIVNLGLIPGIGACLRSSLSNIVVFVVPGAIIVGLKTIWRLASN
ncbi:MAG TPA: hypothetical protein VJI98_00875 [Candidatus Nanoarchaeia archaeon]|nr:hypothetical protein [Candidatus Nanoarchaeia archaeon]